MPFRLVQLRAYSVDHLLQIAILLPKRSQLAFNNPSSVIPVANDNCGFGSCCLGSLVGMALTCFVRSAQLRYCYITVSPRSRTE